MKYRKGFVSNSSSTSYVIEVETVDLKKLNNALSNHVELAMNRLFKKNKHHRFHTDITQITATEDDYSTPVEDFVSMYGESIELENNQVAVFDYGLETYVVKDSRGSKQGVSESTIPLSIDGVFDNVADVLKSMNIRHTAHSESV